MAGQKCFDFLEASKRHYSDAGYLKIDGRLPNAAQLFGFAAECGVKVLIEKLLSKPLPIEYREHANVLVNLLLNLQVLVKGRQNAKYLAGLSLFNAFGTWDTDHRYQSESDIPLTRYMKTWEDASTEVQKVLQQYQIERGL